MSFKSFLTGLLAAVVLALPLTALGEDYEDYIVDDSVGQKEPQRTVPTRALDRFSFESETVDGFWAETGALYTNTDSDADGNKANFDGVSAFGRVAYGGKKWEAGIFFPFYNDFSGHYIENADTQTPVRKNIDVSSIGDIQLYGKFIPLQTDILDAGAGMLFSFPTGDQDRLGVDDSLGTGEVGFLPHFTAQVDLQAAQVRGHIGYEWFTAKNDRRAADRLVYGFGIFIPILNYVTFRNEFTGEALDLHNRPKFSSYLGGLDIRVPIGELDLLLRPTATAGISERAPDWGIGGSIALTSATYK